MATVFDILEEGFKRLGQWNESTATGGSTTTIEDTKLGDVFDDDEWNEGAAFIVYDAGAAGAAPQGEFKRITDYANTTAKGTFTTDTFSAAPASGDRYGYVSSFFPLNDMISVLNTALQSLGPIVLIDITTLDTAASKTEYTYALAWKRNPPIKVEMQTQTGDADDNRWVEVGLWQYRPATAGSTALIVLPQLPTSRDLAIWYESSHPYVQAQDDTIYEGFDIELVTTAFVEKALEWQNSRLMGGDEFLLQRWNHAQVQAAEAKAKFPYWKPSKRASKFLRIGTYTEEDTFTYPDPA